ncbi:hypothetical protein [Methanospirillum hungatei]|nr:hypothetical protein [Methanospirillum hungatei]
MDIFGYWLHQSLGLHLNEEEEQKKRKKKEQEERERFWPDRE